jgi:hypothetical protein
LFWFQKESEDSPCPAGYALSLTESFLNSNSQNDKENFDYDEKALIAGWLDAGVGNGSLSGHPGTALRSEVYLGLIDTLTA